MEVAIIDYNAGNVYSVIHALERLGIRPVLTDDAETICKADKVLFPGQGEASNAMQYLRQHGLDRVILDLRQPMLGICIGQQLMCSHSEEGDTECLGIFDVPVLRFQPRQHEDKVPHMGWNTLEQPIEPFSAALHRDNYYATQFHPEKSGSVGERILANFLEITT